MSRIQPFTSPTWSRMARVVWLAAATAVVPSAWGQAPVVPVGLVTARAVGQGIELDGVLQAVKQSTLSAQASGRITQWLVRAGDRVKAGQLLAVIDDRVSQAGVNQAQAQVAQADAQLANARAQFARTQDLHSKGFVSKAALDVAESQYKSAASWRNRRAQAGQTQTQLAQGFTRLTAPYDGWVLGTHAEAGDLAMPGAPLVTLYAPQPMRAVTHVPASQSACREPGGACGGAVA
jgi:RND family efflux transporter MFP subunit